MIDIVVQGIYFDKIGNGMSTADICNYYLQFTDHLILSCYDYNKDQIKNLDSSIDVILNSSQQETTYNPNNLYWQTKTTLSGFREVNTEHCIKTRTDEYYEDLNLLKYELDKEFVCCNICSQYWKTRAFHLSDHLFRVRTNIFIDVLKEILQILIDNNNNNVADKYIFLDEKLFNLKDIEWNCGSWGAETLYHYKYLEKLGLINKNMDIDTMKEIVKKYSKIIPIGNLGKNSLASISNDRKKQWYSVDFLNTIQFCNNIGDL